MKTLFYAPLICLISAHLALAQIGDFANHADVGNPAIAGQASFSNGVYTVTAVGETIGRNSFQDQFHYVYSEVSGSFSIRATPLFTTAIGEAGLMIRQDLDPSAAHASLLQAADTPPGANAPAVAGSVFPHIRTLKGGGSIVDGDYEPAGFTSTNTGPIRLDRIGNSIHFFTLDENGEWVFRQSEEIPMGATVLAGLAATANSAEETGTFEISDVEILQYPLWVERTIPTGQAQPEATLSTITITAKTREGETVEGVITEKPPIDAEFANVQASDGTVSENDDTIEWTLSGFSGEATLTYDLTLGPRRQASWQGTFNDGEHRESFIGGDTVLPKQPAFTPYEEPIELNPDAPTILQVERGIPAIEGDWGLMLAPRTHSGIAVINMVGFDANSWIEIPIIVPEDFGDVYLFANVRGEDGNSDSFFVEIEFQPAAVGLNTWDLDLTDQDAPGRRQFFLDWVKNREGADPRPFFALTEGEPISLFVAPREDSATIDWFAATNNPNSIDFETFNDVVPDMGETSVAEYMLY